MKTSGAFLVGLSLLLLGACGGGGGASPGPVVNVAPTIDVTGPAIDFETGLGIPGVVNIVYADADPDSVATTDLFADADGSLATTVDQIVIANDRPEQDGAVQSVPWDIGSVPAGTWRVFARTTDGTTSLVDGAAGVVFVNGPATLVMSLPLSPTTVSRGELVVVRYTDNDLDDTATTWLFADRDGLLDTTHDTHVIAMMRPELGGVPQTVRWDTTGVPFGVYRIMGLTWDGTNPPSIQTASGLVTVDNVSFASSAGDLGVERGNGIAAFPDGSSVVTGTFDTDTVFGAGEFLETALVNDGLEDVFVARYFPNGILEWATRAGGTGSDVAYAVTALPDGSAVVTGSFEGAAVFGEGETNETTLFAVGDVDLFLARFNADGTLAWAKRAGATGSFCYGLAIASFPDSSIIVTGTYAGDVTFGPGEAGATPLTWNDGLDVFVARFQSNGNLVWAKRATSAGSEEGLGIAPFVDGTFAVTGWFDGDITFGEFEANQTTLFVFGFSEVFVARFNGDGTLAWASQAGGTNGTAAGQDVATFADGTCVVTGWFAEFMDFGFAEPNETNFLAIGERDAFVARFQSNGLLQWAEQMGGSGFDQGFGIETRSDGTCVVAGYFDGAAFFSLNYPNETLLFSTSSRDLFLARLESDGVMRWVSQAGGTSLQVVPFALTAFADGSLGVTGFFDDGGVLFGAGGNMAWPVFSAGLDDVFIARYNADGGF